MFVLPYPRLPAGVKPPFHLLHLLPCVLLITLLSLSDARPATAGHWVISLRYNSQVSQTDIDAEGPSTYPDPDNNYSTSGVFAGAEWMDGTLDELPDNHFIVQGSVQDVLIPVLTWTADSPADHSVPPDQVLVKLSSFVYVHEYIWYPNDGGFVAEDGLEDSAVDSRSQTEETQVSAGERLEWKANSSRASVVTLTPRTMAAAGGNLAETVDIWTDFHVQVIDFAAKITLSGPTKDSSGNQNILVGQHCTASLSGIPFGDTVSNYQWGITGTTFQTWSADTPPVPVMVGTVQVGIIPENPDATYEVDGPGTLTNPTAGWYWNDLAGGTGNSTQETVICTVTVTPPAGQGAAFTVSATQPITVWTPVWTATGEGASVVVDNKRSPPDFWLYAGPGPQDFVFHGMTWNASLAPPPAPIGFGTGSLAIVQIITGIDAGFTSNTTPAISFPGPLNGQTGLDTSWPYEWTNSTSYAGGMTYVSGDSPGIIVTNAISAHDNDSFEDYLMYCPPSSVQYVPVAKYIWSANMGASLPATGNWINFTGTAGTVTDAQKTGNFLPSNEFPAWTQIVQ